MYRSTNDVISLSSSICDISITNRKRCSNGTLKLSEKSNIQEERDILMEKGIQVNTFLDSTLKFTVFDLIKSNNELNILTGLNSFKMLDTISACVSELQSNNTACKPTTLSTKVKIVLVMMQVKLALSFACVSVLFQIFISCRRIFFNIIAYLSQVLGAVIVWPSKEEIMKNLPLCFQKYRKVCLILDCTEVLVEKPKYISCRILTYFHYYGKHTVKVLVGIVPSGLPPRDGLETLLYHPWDLNAHPRVCRAWCLVCRKGGSW
ncbi:uncharacterized protein LOC111635224 [Centruroides sculpturatus]|uniref:uncharacterized protein LOC111635224 n=1 Tax=Centruroides sculpturatus TaxID=218467 RepID=UPI000C6CDA42|nr:uncharacterized protein LOC111635224 [Centruroides sculpturatus]